MKKIKFSVLMSVYKGDEPENVKYAIESVINQTLLPDQFVIMVDGVVSNEMHNLLDKYAENKTIEIHYRDINLGLGLTLNEGIKYCKYEYIARMDADDYNHVDRFEKQINYIMSHEDIDVVGFNIAEYSSDMKTKLAERRVPETDLEIKQYMKTRNGVNHVTVIYKKESVIKAGSYEDCPYFEDYYLWCKMIKNNCKFYNIQDILMDIRAGEDMAKRRGGIKYCKHILNFERKIQQMNIISKSQFLKNSFVRCSVALVPNFVRASLYKNQLRNTSFNDNENFTILHVANIDNDMSKGTSNIIPNYIIYQSKIKNTKVFFMNCNNKKLDKLNDFKNTLTYSNKEYKNTINDIKPNIVVFHEIYIPKYIRISKFLRKNNIPYIIIPHGGLTKSAQNTKKLKKIAGNILLFNKFINSAKKIQYLSESEKNMTTRKKMDYFILGNGFFDKEIINTYSNKETSGFTITYIGRYDIFIKGLDKLIEAAKCIKQYMIENSIKISVYGTGNIDKIKELVSKFDVSEVVEVNGSTFGADKEIVWKNSNAFIQVSRTEGQPTAVLEAMCHGMPLIVSEGTGFNKIVEEINCGVSCKTEENSIASAIKTLYDRKDDLSEMSKKSFEYAKEHFDWNKISEDSIKEYKKIGD